MPFNPGLLRPPQPDELQSRPFEGQAPSFLQSRPFEGQVGQGLEPPPGAAPMQ